MRAHLVQGLVSLCEALDIPDEFLNERMQGVCHSFGTRTEHDDEGGNMGGFAAWFHYLCKAVEPDNSLYQRWYKSAFFLRKHRTQHGGGVTLVMFGPMPAVTARIKAFLEGGGWRDVCFEPIALFDLVLDGLFGETDMTVWRLLDVISGLEEASLPKCLDTKLQIITHPSESFKLPPICEEVGNKRPTRSTSPSCMAGPSISST
ncbi:hypothetical protein VTJ49DRAFT_34 [Mycothermus thermophilus]|uniref:Uncharacterized protein n=1 Tax=Humicola insolens TaxID=85995 RepID=A0ABR3VRS3_HUMIN